MFTLPVVYDKYQVSLSAPELQFRCLGGSALLMPDWLGLLLLFAGTDWSILGTGADPHKHCCGKVSSSSRPDLSGYEVEVHWGWLRAGWSWGQHALWMMSSPAPGRQELVGGQIPGGTQAFSAACRPRQSCDPTSFSPLSCRLGELWTEQPNQGLMSILLPGQDKPVLTPVPTDHPKPGFLHSGTLSFRINNTINEQSGN